MFQVSHRRGRSRLRVQVDLCGSYERRQARIIQRSPRHHVLQVVVVVNVTRETASKLLSRGTRWASATTKSEGLCGTHA